MTKQQFMSILESRLSVLPPDERRELIQDVESHFAFGLQSGRTEEDIARELGDPFELVREAIGDRHVEDIGMPPPYRRKPDPVRAIAAGTGLFFCGLVAVPFLAALWSGGVAIAAGALACVLSPALVLAEYLVNATFYPAKMFLSVSLVGIGILLVYAAYSAFRGLIKLTWCYSRWNARIMKGGDVR